MFGGGSACAGTTPMCFEGWPTFRPMRGDIDGLAVRCLLGIGRSLQAFCDAQVNRLAYFMAQSPVARSLGRQWLPVEWGADDRS